MSTTLRAMLVASALAAIGLTALSATASATIQSDSNGTSGTKASLVTTGSSTFTIGTSTFTCTTWTMTGAISASSISTSDVGTTWANCTYNVGGLMGALTITDSGNWTFTITKALGGGSFSASMTNGTITWSAAACTITIPPATYSGLTWTNATHSLTYAITGVSWTASGFLCPLPASGSNGSWTGSWSEPTLSVS